MHFHASASLSGDHLAFAGLVLGRRSIRSLRNDPSGSLSVVPPLFSFAASALVDGKSSLYSSATLVSHASKPFAAVLPLSATAPISGKSASNPAMSLNSAWRMSASMLPGLLAAW